MGAVETRGSRTVLDTQPASRLERRISTRRATVAVVGLGYVGLPLLVAIARAGYRAAGLDADSAKIRSLRRGRSYIVDISDDEIARHSDLELADDPSILRTAEVIVICVPTPLVDRTPDLSFVRRAAADVARHLTPGRLVILESTTYPGTTEEVVLPLLEESGLEAGRDFALAYSPERVNPGQSAHRLWNTPKVVAGLTSECADLAAAFYRRVVHEVVVASSLRDAEMAKLIENTFRQVNIALVNEMATLAPDLGVDIWAALEAAATKPFGYLPFWPGPGVGGHCIAIDPSYLSWRVGQRLGFGIGFVEHAKEVNNRMPGYVASRIGDALNEAGKPIKGSKVMGLGLAYKGGVNDVRESPSVAVMERLARAGAVCSYHDPFVPTARVFGEELSSQPLTPEFIAQQDCVAILTAHPGVDHEAVIRAAVLVFDARGLTRGSDHPNVVRL